MFKNTSNEKKAHSDSNCLEHQVREEDIREAVRKLTYESKPENNEDTRSSHIKSHISNLKNNFLGYSNLKQEAQGPSGLTSNEKTTNREEPSFDAYLDQHYSKFQNDIKNIRIDTVHRVVSNNQNLV